MTEVHGWLIRSVEDHEARGNTITPVLVVDADECPADHPI